MLFSHSAMSNSLLPHELQHSRPPCHSPSPEVCPSSGPLNCWCHQAISSSDTLFSFCPQSIPAIYKSAVHIIWPKYLNFSISPFNVCSGFIFLKIYWFDLAGQRTFRSPLQYHSSKASIIWHSAFFIVQLSQPYVTTGKTIALNMWSFVNRVMSLLFNKLSRFVIAFLPRSNHLILQLQSPSSVMYYAEYIMQNARLDGAQAGIDCCEKYQQSQICRWYHPYGRKWRETKEPLDECETGEWKSLQFNI